jgi:hypothetical protein
MDFADRLEAELLALQANALTAEAARTHDLDTLSAALQATLAEVVELLKHGPNPRLERMREDLTLMFHDLERLEQPDSED